MFAYAVREHTFELGNAIVSEQHVRLAAGKNEPGRVT